MEVLEPSRCQCGFVAARKGYLTSRMALAKDSHSGSHPSDTLYSRSLFFGTNERILSLCLQNSSLPRVLKSSPYVYFSTLSIAMRLDTRPGMMLLYASKICLVIGLFLLQSGARAFIKELVRFPKFSTRPAIGQGGGSSTHSCHLSTSRTLRMTLASGYAAISSSAKRIHGVSVTALQRISVSLMTKCEYSIRSTDLTVTK